MFFIFGRAGSSSAFTVGCLLQVLAHSGCGLSATPPHASAVIIGIDEYNQLKKNYRPSFIEQVNKWKQKTGIFEQSDYEAFEKALKRNKEIYSEENIF